MRTRTKVIATVGVAAVALATFAGSAFADPSSTPPDASIVAVGSDTITPLADQFSSSYTGTPAFYSYDAVAPDGDTNPITTKTGCTSITRPNGSGAGLTALGMNARPSGDTTDYCIDIARSSRTPGASDPDNLAFVPIAEDAVTYTAENATNVPANLTTAELTEIYSCNDGSGNPVTENEIGGTGTDAVVPVIPQSSSGTRSFFLSKIGVGGTGQPALGSCVVPTDNSVEENEGSNAVFGRNSPYDTKDIVFPYSIGAYLSQTVHNNGDSFNNPGPLVLKSINGVAPTTGSGSKTVINKKFPYTRNLFFVVRSTGKSAKYVPAYLQPFLGKDNDKGYVCSKNGGVGFDNTYGFLSLGSKCGVITAADLTATG